MFLSQLGLDEIQWLVDVSLGSGGVVGKFQATADHSDRPTSHPAKQKIIRIQTQLQVSKLLDGSDHYRVW